MDYAEKINNSFFILFVAAILLVILVVCGLFLKRSWKECLSLGITEKELKTIVANSVGISLVPSIPIVLSVMVMVPVLGIALPWLRTSVIGSASNELISATMAVEAMGIKFSASDMTPLAYVNAAWGMTLGCSIGLLLGIVALKPVCATYETFKKKDSKWINIFSLCALITVIAAFCVSNAKKGVVPTLVIVISFIFSYLCLLIGKNERWKFVKDFSFPLTIIVGLAVSVIATHALGK